MEHGLEMAHIACFETMGGGGWTKWRVGVRRDVFPYCLIAMWPCSNHRVLVFTNSKKTARALGRDGLRPQVEIGDKMTSRTICIGFLVP